MRYRKQTSDHHTTGMYADKKPRLVSLKQERKEQKMRDELNGEAEKKAIKSVTLPKFSWDK